MIKLNPPKGMRNVFVTGRIRRVAEDVYEAPEAEAKGLISAGWAVAPEAASPEIPEVRVVVDEPAITADGSEGDSE